MTKEQKQIAQQIFSDNSDINAVFMNPKGEFFTEESYAKNSVKGKSGVAAKIEVLNRSNKKTGNSNSKK